MSVTSAHIVTALRALGVRGGDLMLVHSSLKSFGHVIGGAEATAGALVESISPGGSLFVPTFNYGDLVYDPATTPSLDGAITNAVRLMPTAQRSLHPTHPVAGIGPQAAEILQGHEHTHAFGAGSPLWRLWQQNAWILLIGVDHCRSSIIHVAEERLNMPYLDVIRPARVLRDGQVVQVNVRRPSCSAAFNVVDEPLRSKGQIREVLVGSSRLMLMKAADVVAVAEQLLQADPAALRCRRPECTYCIAAHAIIGH